LCVLIVNATQLIGRIMDAHFKGAFDMREKRMAMLENQVTNLREVSANHAKAMIELQRKATNEALRGMKV
jgi:hypothetical protein